MEHRREDYAADYTVTATIYDTDAGTVTTEVDGTQTGQRPITPEETQELLDRQAAQDQATYGTPAVMMSALVREYSSGQDTTSPPPWVQPLGAHDAYLPGALVSHTEHRWRNDLTILNAWEPGTQNAGWTDLDPPDPGVPQPWVQPTGSTDAYNVGDLVTHVGSTWESQIAANVWEPGVYGWTEVA